MTPGYDYFDVEADVGIIGRGNTAAEAFVQTALGVFALIVEPASVEPRDRREVRAHAETLEALLVTWVNECLYVHEVEGFVARDVDLEVFETSPRAGGEPLRLHSFLRGEELDPTRHRLGTIVKAATFHQVSVGPAGEGYEARLIVDV
ncbi:MAG TPA: archease [Verrucomicrobiae bacterium]|jgi:SHS2 domain-containing protein|nr:archease [Verrucomicrobiae bacterium]